MRNSGMPQALSYLDWMQQNMNVLLDDNDVEIAKLSELAVSLELMKLMMSADLFKEHHNYAGCDSNLGVTNVTASMVDNVPSDLQAILDYDRSVLTQRTFYPNITGNFPETTGPNAIAPTAPYFVGNKIDPNVYAKERSISHTLGYPPRLSLFTTDQTDPRITLFLKNIENRGFDNSAIHYHLEKRQYMSALDPWTIVNRYDDPIEKYANTIQHSTIVSKKPLLSSVDDATTDFFLDVHLGVRNHPKFVKDWFYNFSSVTADLNPNKLYTPTAAQMKVITTRLIYMWQNAECVRSYFEEMVKLIEEEGNTCTLIWHWRAAGMVKEKALTEAMHNIVAYRQLINTIYLIVKQALLPPASQINTGGKSYFEMYASAPTESVRIDWIREIFRLELPNGASFSSLKNPPGGVHQQVLHIHKLIELQAEGSPVGWYQINLAKYAAGNFTASFDSLRESPTERKGRCPFGFSDSNVAKSEAVKKFKLSGVDSSTVVWTDYENYIPVFPTPRFSPFGLGDRRCPGEQKAIRTIQKFMDKFKCILFYRNTTVTDAKMIPVAPYTWIRDDIYVNMTHTLNHAACA